MERLLMFKYSTALFRSVMVTSQGRILYPVGNSFKIIKYFSIICKTEKSHFCFVLIFIVNIGLKHIYVFLHYLWGTLTVELLN